MKDNTDIPFDIERMIELMENYQGAETRKEQRKIENEVLEATVWQECERSDTRLDPDRLDDEELRFVYNSPQEADVSEKVRSIVRGKLLKDV